MILVDLDGVSMSRPGRPLFTDLSLTVASGDRLGVVGLNGSGKSTLLRVMAGEIEPETGAVRRGRGARVAFLEQRPSLPAGTVRGAVGGGWEAAAILDRLGMGAMADRDTSGLSGGQAKRVALARVLLADAELVILDEPTNHLDIDAIAWLEDRLAGFKGGLVLVTHDRHVLDRVTTRVLEIDRGHGYSYDGGYDRYLEARTERRERAVSAESVRRNLARRELAWLRRGAPARTRKPQARIDAATAIVEGRPEGDARSGELDLHLGTPRLGDKVVELTQVSFAYGDGPWLLERLDLGLDRRERLGIVGPNGSGKSTLLDLLAGRRAPLAGVIERGPTVRLGYYDQLGVELDPAQPVHTAVAGDTTLLERFWFDADAQKAPIGTLSGGERRRLQLLLTLAAKPNVLLLDEPTNDLDLDTLRALEDFLEDWPGALVVVSHDRAFLERAVVAVLSLDGAGRAGLVPGGYAAWEAGRRAVRTSTSAGRASSAVAPAGRVSSASAATPKPRSPSTVRRLLEQAERELTRLTAERDRLAARLAAGGDHRELTRTSLDLAAAQAHLTAAEERWLALADEL